MNERVQRLFDSIKVDQFPICIEKASLVLEAYKKYEGYSTVMRRALATAYYLDNKTLRIDDDELIVGNIASKFMGMEAGSLSPAWPDDDFDDLLSGGRLTIDPEDRKKLRAMDEYWLGKGRTMDEAQGRFYDDERLWPFIRSGILCPPWMKKDQGRGYGSAGVGWGLGNGLSLLLPDYEKIVTEGIYKTLTDAREELRNLRYVDADSVKKGDFLNATIIALEAMVRLYHRFGRLAETMAGGEKKEARKKELLRIADICHWIAENPSRDFRDAIQAFFFYWMMIASGTTPGGRFDQYMYPFYKKDIEAAVIDDNEVLELLECLRIKIMQLNFVGGGKNQRDKWAGMSRWHNFLIGGVKRDGTDGTNPLSYLILESARDCPTPHFTISLRVWEKTPPELLQKAVEVVATGIGMPAFISDDAYIDFLVREGIPLEEARDYGIAGCLDLNLPGKSRTNAFGMFIVPLVLVITMNNGVLPMSGEQLGPKTGDMADFTTYEDFHKAFMAQLRHFMGLTSEEHNILLSVQRDLYPDVVHSAFMHEGIKVGKDALDRVLPFENNSALNVVGMVNTADSLSAVKKLVFDDKRYTMKQLKEALDADWNGFDEMREDFKGAPKYGNGDEYVDQIVGELFADFCKLSHSFTSIQGATVKPTAISITAHAPAGMYTPATPDGRKQGDTFADGSLSPAQGMDFNGPTGVIRSAVHIDQGALQAVLLNMKLHPSALKTSEDYFKLGVLIRAYFKNGGKHMQFNVVSREVLEEAMNHPAENRDLIVRVAGFSAYFVTLTPKVQEEIMNRSELLL